jgi:WD40 repeat protein
VKTLKIWDLETLKNISDIQAHTHFVKGLAILEEQKWIATACDKYINIWDMISMQKVCSLTGHNVDIKQLYMDNNHVLYSAGKGLNN